MSENGAHLNANNRYLRPHTGFFRRDRARKGVEQRTEDGWINGWMDGMESGSNGGTKERRRTDMQAGGQEERKSEKTKKRHTGSLLDRDRKPING
mmetsp:Transcript_48/g.174  ORF Transcript_48/g.174 Transcript_48/m.174 type:complete len:95 (-) Transcript_48:480-764(-)